MSTDRWNAKDYELHSRPQQDWGRELMAKLALQGAETVLDIGCGDGKVTADIAARLHRGKIIGIDNSESMIRRAREKFPPADYPNLSFTKMDARRLTFSNTFDRVFSNAALHWVKNHEPVLRGIYNGLKPGGRMLLQMGGRGNAGQILSILDSLLEEAAWKPFFDSFPFPYGFFGPEEYKSLLADTGFEARRVVLIPKNMELSGRAGLKGWLRTTWLPYTHRIPEDKRDAFIDAIARRYIKRFPLKADNVVHVSMVRLEVEARKR